MRIVIKVGSSSITHKTGLLNIKHIEEFVKVLCDISNAGNELLLVSSGAIAMGAGKLHFAQKPEKVSEKQALASIGQCELMYVYDKLFAEYNHIVSQVLLTQEDFNIEKRRCNLIATLDTLLSYGVIPIINENDSVATDEIAVGDNDTLSALVAAVVKADMLVIFSDIDGLYDADPNRNNNAKKIDIVNEITDDIVKLAGDSNSNFGTGGMLTKILAARIATEAGADMIIANGARSSDLYAIISGENVGTRFLKK